MAEWFGDDKNSFAGEDVEIMSLVGTKQSYILTQYKDVGVQA